MDGCLTPTFLRYEYLHLNPIASSIQQQAYHSRLISTFLPQDEPEYHTPPAKLQCLLWQRATAAARLDHPHATLLQTTIQVSTNGLRNGHMGDVESDHSPQEGLQINVLPCALSQEEQDIWKRPPRLTRGLETYETHMAQYKHSHKQLT